MNRKEHIDRSVEDTLFSLDGLKRAEPAPFFYTRLMARMEGENATSMERFLALVSRPAFAITTAVIFLLLNGLILSSLFRSRQLNSGEEPGQAMAYEYTHSTSNNTFYANNPEHP